MAKVSRTPRTMAEALKMGFESGGGMASTLTQGLTKERGYEDMSHPDGQRLLVPYVKTSVFGRPRKHGTVAAARLTESIFSA